jgi:hypothetical protein
MMTRVSANSAAIVSVTRKVCASLPRFGAIIDSALRLGNSITIEVALLVVVFVGGRFFWSTMSGVERVVQESATWCATKGDTDVRLSPAGGPARVRPEIARWNSSPASTVSDSS